MGNKRNVRGGAVNDSVIFIPQYLLNALVNEEMSFQNYITYIQGLRANLPAEFESNPWSGYRLVMNPHYEESDDSVSSVTCKNDELDAIRKEVESIHDKLFDTLGSYEAKNLFHINKLLYQFFDLSSWSDDSGIHINILNESIQKRFNTYMNNDKEVLSLFNSTDEIKFKDSYEIIDAGVTIIVVKEGFSNYLTKEAKAEFLRDLVDKREQIIGKAIYHSNLLAAYVGTKLN